MGCPSTGELLIIFVAIFFIFGATRLPQLGDALGRAIRNFKRSLSGENEIDVTPEQPKLPPNNEDGESGAS